MKSNLYIIFFLFILSIPLKVIGQQKITIGDGFITQINNIEKKADSVLINIDMALFGRKTDNLKSLDYTFALESGNIFYNLPKISLKGRANMKNFKRSISLLNDSQLNDYNKNSQYKVVANYSRKATNYINYSVTIPFESWMSNARLVIKKDECGCDIKDHVYKRILANNIGLPVSDLPQIIDKKDEYTNVVKEFTPTPLYSPKLIHVKPLGVDKSISKFVSSQRSITLRLEYATYVKDLDLYYGNNMHEVLKIDEMLSNLYNDEYVKITGVTINGYASPDGPLIENQKLSKERAYSLMRYLLNKFPLLPKSLYTIKFGGENWDDLVDILNKSNMPHKEEVLDIIHNYAITEYRESKIINLRDGTLWKYMIRNYFNSLRKAEVTVYYNAYQNTYQNNKVNINELVYKLNNAPSTLSLNEIFILSNNTIPSSKQYKDLYDVAIKYYPNDNKVLINSALLALAINDYAKASSYLKNVNPNTNIPEYYNAMGALYLMRDNDIKKSNHYFNIAVELGLNESENNIIQ